MADVASALKDWSEIAANNGPGGTATVGAGLDDNLREIQKVIKKALGHIVSVKDYGAVGDGATDDTSAINSAISEADVITIPDGDYKISSKLSLGSNKHLILQSEARIVADSSFSDSMMIEVVEGAGTDPALDWSITGGILDGDNEVDRGIDVVYGRFAKIQNIKVVGANERGVILGSDGSSPSTDIDLFGIKVWFHEETSGTPPTNTSTSIGILYDSCTDSFVQQCNVIGYRTGFKTESASVDFNLCHAWTRSTLQGAMTRAFDIDGSFCALVQCYADTPSDGGSGAITDVYGFYIRKFGARLIGCQVFNNPAAGGTDNKLTGIYLGVAISQTSVVSPTFNSGGNASFRFKEYIGGSVAAADKVSIIDIHDDAQVVTSTNRNNYLSDRPWIFNSQPIFSGVNPDIRGAAATNRDLLWTTAGTSRWRARCNNTTESGANAGSNWRLESLDDAGAFLGTLIEVIRSSGQVRLGDSSGSGTRIRLNTDSGTTVGAAGGASALPATPTGYITVNVNGTDRKMAYYAT